MGTTPIVCGCWRHHLRVLENSMPVFCVNYDLSAPGRDYVKIAAGIEKVSSDNIRPLKSCWLVSTAMNRVEILRVLREHVDSNDRLLVFQVNCGEWVAEGLDLSSVNWLLLHAALEADPPMPLGVAALFADPSFPPDSWRLGDLPPLPFPPPPPRLGALPTLPLTPEPRSLGNLLTPPAPSSAKPPNLGELILRHAGVK